MAIAPSQEIVARHVRVATRAALLTLTLLLPLICGCGIYLGILIRDGLEDFVVPLEEFDFELCEDPPNGCGPEGLFSVLVPNCPLGLPCFTPACNTHDLCYRTCGQSQDNCDFAFLDDIDAICLENLADNPDELERCRRIANIYVNVVIDSGPSFFQASQNFACVCDDPNLNPNLMSARILPHPTLMPDTDGDTLPDALEMSWGLDPGDVGDARRDDDGDGLINLHELIHGTNPFMADTDGDGTSDSDQVRAHAQTLTSDR